MPVYSWNRGFHATIDAKVFAERYEWLREQYGEVTAQTIVDDARAKLSPIHLAFEWDNKVAGHQYRLQQARHLMTSIRVVDESVDLIDQQPTRYLVSILPQATRAESSKLRAYVPIVEALQDTDLRQEVLMRAVGELRAFQARYREMSELAGVLDAISKVVEDEELVAATP